MFNFSNICRQPSVTSFILLQTRFKTKIHWAKLKKKTSAKYKALNHFDDFYGSVFGDKWDSMREALLRRSKYVAVVNNYGDADETMEYLTNRKDDNQHSSRLQEFAEKTTSDTISKIYPNSVNIPDRLDLSDYEPESKNKTEKEEKNIKQSNKTLDESLAEAIIDESRIIDPTMGITSEALYQFIPATKLKGADEWIPESAHYSYHSKGTDFPLAIEPETDLVYPEHLKVFTYEMDSDWTSFPEPKRCQTGVYNYYPMDCGSVLAVLALGLTAGNRVLDLCSAPGGKALVALQTLLPDVVICNDISISRSNRMRRIFKDYLFDFETSNRWQERVLFKSVDGRYFIDDLGFDKVLVDVPCTTDRHSVNEDENNIFRPDRIKERLKIPEMQSQLLSNALKLVKVGGSVVYSTCSLSPIQNDGVVHFALKNAFEDSGIIATVRDLSASLSGFSSTLHLGTGSSAPKYGQLVLPSVTANFGPSYIAKLVRVK